MLRSVRFAGLFIFLAIGPLWAEDRINISVSSDQEIIVQANGAPKHQRTTDATPASVSTMGSERSECRPYGRASSASADASSRIVAREGDSIAFELLSKSFAQGGHYRTCSGGCLGNNCLFIEPEDTAASAQSSASARVYVEAISDAPQISYLLRIGFSSVVGAVDWKVEDASGRTLSPVEGDAGLFLIDEKTPAVVATVRAVTGARNEGGCCSEEKEVRGTVSLKVEKAAVLFSAFTAGLNEPFIYRGEATSEYRNVAALLLDGQMHCTGTLVGARTLLTAAHCVQPYEKQIMGGHLGAVFGANVTTSRDFATTVTEAAFPSDANSGFRYNSSSYEDDIAVVYLADAPPFAASTLYAASPSWDEIIARGYDIRVVGFGYNSAAGEARQLGVKREGVIRPELSRNRIFQFGKSDVNTCHGDSGGPSFLEVPGQPPVLVGVTSYGPDTCTMGGVNTRVDAYAGWLSGRIR